MFLIHACACACAHAHMSVGTHTQWELKPISFERVVKMTLCMWLLAGRGGFYLVILENNGLLLKFWLNMTTYLYEQNRVSFEWDFYHTTFSMKTVCHSVSSSVGFLDLYGFLLVLMEQQRCQHPWHHTICLCSCSPKVGIRLIFNYSITSAKDALCPSVITSP